MTDVVEGPSVVGAAFVGVSPGTRAPKIHGVGRVCAAERCGTVLSVYNPSDLCSVHAPPPSQLPGRHRSAASSG
jgi:hypothetical protein